MSSTSRSLLPPRIHTIRCGMARSPMESMLICTESESVCTDWPGAIWHGHYVMTRLHADWARTSRARSVRSPRTKISPSQSAQTLSCYNKKSALIQDWTCGTFNDLIHMMAQLTITPTGHLVSENTLIICTLDSIGISAVAAIPWHSEPSTATTTIHTISPHTTICTKQRPSFNMPTTHSTASTTHSGCSAPPPGNETTSSLAQEPPSEKSASQQWRWRGGTKGEGEGEVKGEGKGQGRQKGQEDRWVDLTTRTTMTNPSHPQKNFCDASPEDATATPHLISQVHFFKFTIIYFYYFTSFLFRNGLF